MYSNLKSNPSVWVPSTPKTRSKLVHNSNVLDIAAVRKQSNLVWEPYSFILLPALLIFILEKGRWCCWWQAACIYYLCIQAVTNRMGPVDLQVLNCRGMLFYLYFLLTNILDSLKGYRSATSLSASSTTWTRNNSCTLLITFARGRY